jgi:hypothetical protein
MSTVTTAFDDDWPSKSWSWSSPDEGQGLLTGGQPATLAPYAPMTMPPPQYAVTCWFWAYRDRLTVRFVRTLSLPFVPGAGLKLRIDGHDHRVFDVAWDVAGGRFVVQCDGFPIPHTLAKLLADPRWHAWTVTDAGTPP